MVLETQSTRQCRLCKAEKPLSEFYFRKDSNKHRSECKVCMIESHRYKQTGVCKAKYHEMLVVQKGSCAICGSKFNNSRSSKLSVDHCHKTGKVRGLLCSNCNTAIGLMKDSIIRLEKAIEYLKRQASEDIV